MREINSGLFNIERERIKKDWLRASISLTDTISYLEKDLAKAKKNNAPESVIIGLDERIENLIDFYNKTQSCINLLEHELTIQRLNTKINEQLFKEIIFPK